jgi:hypothetical protein
MFILVFRMKNVISGVYYQYETTCETSTGVVCRKSPGAAVAQ